MYFLVILSEVLFRIITLVLRRLNFLTFSNVRIINVLTYIIKIVQGRELNFWTMKKISITYDINHVIWFRKDKNNFQEWF
jgi:hypothetical protein